MKNLSRITILICITVMLFSSNVFAASAELIAASTTATATPTKNNDMNVYAVITAEPSVDMRSNSSGNTYTVATHPKGYALSVLGAEYGWVFVSDDSGKKGYVKGTSIAFKNGKKPDNRAVVAKAREEQKGISIASFAQKYLGTPYVWGGTNLSTGVDCSGFVYCVYKNFGYNLNRSSSSMYAQGKAVNKNQLMAGDLVFFGSNGNVNHVGIYIGNNNYIHSSSTSVIISSLNKVNSAQPYIGARRII